MTQAYLFASLFLCLLISSPVLSAQEENHVIVKDFNWAVYATEHFDIHYYDDSKAWLPYAAGVLEQAYKEQAATLNPALAKRIPFFLYASINHMQQNNIAHVGDGVGGAGFQEVGAEGLVLALLGRSGLEEEAAEVT